MHVGVVVVAVAIAASPAALSVAAIVDRPDVNIGQILTLTVTVENVGDKPAKIVAGLWPRLRFSATGPDGQAVHAREYTPGDPGMIAPSYQILAPGKSWTGICRVYFTAGDDRFDDLRLKAGDYRLRAAYGAGEAEAKASPSAAGLWIGSVTSNELVFKVGGNLTEAELTAGVVALDVRKDSEILALGVDPSAPLDPRAPRFTVKPMKLTLTFTNRTEKPVKLDAYDLPWRLMGLKVVPIEGDCVRLQDTRADVKRTPPEPRAEDFPIIEPGKSWTLPAKVDLPGTFGGVACSIVSPGRFNFYVSYVATAESRLATPLAEGCWTGTAVNQDVYANAMLRADLRPEGLKAEDLPRYIASAQDRTQPYQVRRDVVRAIARTEAPAAREFLKGLVKDEGEDDGLRRLALELLFGANADGVEALAIEAIPATARQVQRAAIDGLGMRRSAAAVPALCELVAAPKKSEASYRAVIALGRIADKRAEPTLRKELQAPKDAFPMEETWQSYLRAVQSSLDAIEKGQPLP